MAKRTKISFSSEEQAYLQQTDLLLSKRKITEKLYALLGEVRQTMQPVVSQYQDVLQDIPLTDVGKISRGENYLDLPYVILDYPRHFNGDNVLTCRTMIWWGQHVSFTLHLQGSQLLQHRGKLIANLPTLVQQPIYISVGPDPWQHHFEADNYQLLSQVVATSPDWPAWMQQRSFVRLAFKLPITNLQTAATVAPGFYKLLLDALR